LTITVPACNGAGPRHEPPDLTGAVDSVGFDSGVLLFLVSVAFSGGPAGGDQAVIRTNDATVVQYVGRSGTWVSGSPRDIHAGASIRVWTDGRRSVVAA
jgi:hypothetical protein